MGLLLNGLVLLVKPIAPSALAHAYILWFVVQVPGTYLVQWSRGRHRHGRRAMDVP